SWVLGCYGNQEVRTPNLDRICQTGTRFQSHLACAPVAGASRATLLTGRTTMQLHDAESVPAGEVTLDKILGAQGYMAQALEGAAPPDLPSNPGKPLFLTVSYKIQPPDEGVARKYADLYAQAKLDTFSREPAAGNARQDKEMLAGGLDSRRKAAAAITALDDQIGALIGGLSQKKLMDNTLVIFVSTCGPRRGGHGRGGAGLSADPINMYEEVGAPPMFWSWPGRVPAQATRPELVSTYDLVPTLCELTGAD